MKHGLKFDIHKKRTERIIIWELINGAGKKTVVMNIPWSQSERESSDTFRVFGSLNIGSYCSNDPLLYCRAAMIIVKMYDPASN